MLRWQTSIWGCSGLLGGVVLIGLSQAAAAQDVRTALSPAFEAVQPKVIAWRRDIHQGVTGRPR
jgi:hypothetical protein